MLKMSRKIFELGLHQANETENGAVAKTLSSNIRWVLGFQSTVSAQIECRRSIKI